MTIRYAVPDSQGYLRTTSFFTIRCPGNRRVNVGSSTSAAAGENKPRIPP